MEEFVIAISQDDLDRLRTILQDAYLHGPKRYRKSAWDLTNRLMHNCDKITLKWLDDKLAEFP